MHPVAPESRFDWPVCSQAEALVLAKIEAFLTRNDFARSLAGRLKLETGTLLLDWVDYLTVTAADEPEFLRVGYAADPFGETAAGQRALWHAESVLPRVVVDETGAAPALAIHVDSVADFMAAHHITGSIEGGPMTRFRHVLASGGEAAPFHVVERRGYRGTVPADAKPGATDALLQAIELWQTRPRRWMDAAAGFDASIALIDRLIGMVGRDLTCHVVFLGERVYWEARNRAGQVQKARQDRLGLGWGNHDHHTFRSSREGFVPLMTAMERLGFERRERYYAGAQAGWGAQIMEQPVEGIVIFCDVDLLPDETEVDFSRQRLPAAPKLGTIGLWTGLHGESFLDAGMHHLEAKFDHALCRDQLAGLGVNTMKPFSDFDFLKQAFTEGERWQVSPERLARLLGAGLITQEQHETFRTQGAVGSHLENLQRKGGFKGFNQQSVSAIIAAVDPRKLAGA